MTTGEILVSAGGGAAGRALLEAALAARCALCLAHLPWRLITGPNLPEADIAALRAGAPSGVVIERFRPDFPALLRNCRVSVSQAGYNTVLDLLRARARAVLVPFAAGRETEQTRAPSVWPRSAPPNWCARAICPRRRWPQRSSARPRARHRTLRSTPAGRRARPG